jgi:hypothetical protein
MRQKYRVYLVFLGYNKGVREMAGGKIWTQRELLEFSQLFPFCSNSKLSALFGRSLSSIRFLAWKNGLTKEKTTRAISHSEGKGRKYTIDHRYFSEVKDQDQAYILGFILGDGNVPRKGYKINFCNHWQDLEVLDFIKLKVNSNRPIRAKVGKPHFILELNSVEMVNDLISLGIRPNKSLSMFIPEIRKDLYRHLVRGLFDADGHVVIPNDLRSVRTGLTGCKYTCDYIQQVIATECHVGGGVYRSQKDNNNTYQWQLGGRLQVQRFAKWIYKDANFFLSRKYNRFVEAGLL